MATEPTQTTALVSLQDRAIKAIGLDKTEAQLIVLASTTKDITAITNEAGYQQVHAARMVLRNTRIDIEKKSAAARDEANQFAKEVRRIEKDFVKLISPEEDRLLTLQSDWDEAKEREKERKAEEERQRVASIQESIDEIRATPDLYTNKPAADIAKGLEALKTVVIGDNYAEFQINAKAALQGTIARLQAIYNARAAYEAEQERIRLERIELEQLRAAQAERDRVAREEAAARQAELDRVAAEQKREREAIATEAARVKQQQDDIDEENLQLQLAREKFEREQAEPAKPKQEVEPTTQPAEQEKPQQVAAEQVTTPAVGVKSAKRPKPSMEEIIAVLAAHYGVTREAMQKVMASYDWLGVAA